MTARLPFDPSKMRGAPPPPTPANAPSPGFATSPSPRNGQGGTGEAQPDPLPRARGVSTPAADPRLLSVSALASLIAGALDSLPKAIRVVGEVSGFRERTHWYFDLKDAEAVVNCVVFASAARRCGFALQNGQSVVATGRLDFYAKGGKVSFVCDRLEPVGAGALELAYRRLVEEIRALGWFDPARKRPLPTFPRRVAVITSRTGAALQDVIDTARRRCMAVELLVVDARVQGDRAAQEVAAAINWLGANHARLGIDALLITRGGGSMEDLWAFNEKIVAAAIVSCPIPVVAAIGHETDTTIAELVADERCATPTQAAMRLIPDGCAMLEQVEALSTRLRTSMDRLVAGERRRVESAGRHGSSAVRLTVAAARARVDRLGSRLDQQRPAAAQARREARLAEAQRRLAAAARGAVASRDLASLEQALTATINRDLRRRADSIGAAERTLSAVSPLRVLARGYSVTTRADGRAVRSPHDVRPGDPIATRLADGTVHSTVDGPTLRDREPHPPEPIRPDLPPESPRERPPLKPPARRAPRGRDDAPSLFE